MRERTGELAIRFTLLLILAPSLAGCTTQVIPPSAPLDPVTVYLTDYGKHSSVVLPADEGGFDEYAFGDWAYFAQGQTGLPVAIRALLDSPQSTLGWRRIPPTDDLNAALGAQRLSAITVPRSRAAELSIQLKHRFRSTGETPFHSSYSGMEHVRDNEHYWGCHNCNHVTAAWLRALGCEVRGPGIFSDFVVTTPQAR